MPEFKKSAISSTASSHRWMALSTRLLSAVVLALVVGVVAAVADSAVSVGSLGAALAIVVLGAFVCAEFRRVSWLRLIGIDTALCLVVPSLLADLSWVPRNTIGSLGAAMERLDVVGWVISVLVLGGCVQVDWKIMRSMAMKLGVPVFCGSLAALAATWGWAALWATDFSSAFFLQVAPMMAGGLTAGALPLATGYANQWGQMQGALLAQMLPSLLVANLLAIAVAGIIGMIRPADGVRGAAATSAAAESVRAGDIGMAIGAIIALYVCGAVVSHWFGVSSPLVVILVGMTASALDGIPAPVVRGMKAVQNYFTSYLLFPVLWLVGLMLVPWEYLVAGLAAPLLSMAFAAVLALSVTGYLVSRWMGLNPADGATITLSRVAMGGTGAIAILSAGDRVNLLPFALLVTRLGGALTVLLTLQAATVLQP
ncbi:malate:Na+ symporter [Bradyrhizobium sp. AZCC 1578]|uniref:2-hydroxycarboxylate transporter family protein n=1 Tax=Bradyrhizobium sp. AZCC 1578 TaxID=3117027 RepID=UPI002FF25402